jgi:hypothetical protein
MTQYVHGDCFVAHGWAGVGGNLYVFGKAVFESVTTEGHSGLGGE